MTTHLSVIQTATSTEDMAETISICITVKQINADNSYL